MKKTYLRLFASAALCLGLAGSMVPVNAFAENTGSGITSPARTPIANGTPKIWVNDDTATVYTKLSDAVNNAADGATVHISGNFTASAEDPMNVTVGKNITIDIVGDTVMKGNGNNGITLLSGSHIKCSNGASLTMSGFKTAFTVNVGAEVNDGKYNFKDNTDGTNGFYIGGSVKGSTDKNSVLITADDKCETNFYSSSTRFENCTLNVNSRTRTWFDGNDLYLKNASLTVAGYGQGYYVNNLNMENSELIVNKGSSYITATGICFQGAGVHNISNSLIKINAGSTAGLSIATGTYNVTNSTMEFANGGIGGLNVNKGKVYFTNSILKGDGNNSGSLFGVQANDPSSLISFSEDSRVETPASSDRDNGLDQIGKAYIVMGGSHKISYASNFYGGAAIPVNTPEYGSEKLSYFKLADNTTSSVEAHSKLGTTYTYPVNTASEDGQKYIWVPGDKVVFKLNNANAKFADNTTADKETMAIRGHLLSEASQANGKAVEIPSDPSGVDKFVGWFYVNANGEETAFDPAAVKVDAPLEVYAKWENTNEKYGVVYHNSDEDPSKDVTYLDTNNKADRTIEVADVANIIAGMPNFQLPGKVFDKWTSDKAGMNEVKTGSTLTVPAGSKTIDLYAQWKEASYKVKFSANGGTFADNSIFKTKPDVFDIEKDANGGEVAVVKKDAKYQASLNELLKSLDPGVTTDSKGISAPTENIAVKPYHHIDKTANSLFGFTWYTYNWYTDDTGSQNAGIGTQTKIENDTTYYLKWVENDNIQSIENQFGLESDIFGRSQSESSMSEFIKENANDFSLTGAIETSSIKDEMMNIENMFPDAASDYSKIKLSDIASEFTATLTLPEKVIVPADPEVTLGGFGNAFTLKEKKVEGNNVIVKFTLKEGITTYKELKDAVGSTGQYPGG